MSSLRFLPQARSPPRRRPASALPRQPFIDAPVRHAVRFLVRLSRDVLVADRGKGPRHRADLRVQALEGGILHPEPPGQLLDQQLAVRAEQHVGGAQLPCPLQAFEDRRVFGDIVGGDADPSSDTVHHASARRRDHHPDARRAGVAARSPVTGDDQAKTTIRRQYSHLFTPSVRFKRSSSIAESFSWHAWHTPSTSAATATPRFCPRRSSYSSSSSSSNSGTSFSLVARFSASSASIRPSSSTASPPTASSLALVC